MTDTFYDVMRRQGITRRSFLKFCCLTAAAMGLSPIYASKIAHAIETNPRIPVLWLHGLECTCCSESFIRSAHPLAKDVILSMISLDYDDTIMAAAGHEAEAIVDEVIEEHRGKYIIACEGNPGLEESNTGGMSCIIGGKPYTEQLRRAAKDAKAIISWGSCASWGCVQAAAPNPTGATPIHKVPDIGNAPIIKVPGCPPIAEVMTAVITYILTFERLPSLDRQGRPKMFYSQRIHDKCYRRPHFDAGQFVEAWDDDAAGGSVEARVTLVNSAPRPPTVAITPKKPKTGDRLEAYVAVDGKDDDGDRLSYRFSWLLDGKAVSGLDGPAVSPDRTRKGQKWKVRVVASDGKLDPVWRTLFLKFPDRFIYGSDTWITPRWEAVVPLAQSARAWLGDLPKDIAEKIAFRNAQRIFSIPEQ